MCNGGPFAKLKGDFSFRIYGREVVKCALGEVHVWRIGLECEGVGAAALEAALSADERAKAERFYFPGLKKRWTITRGALRYILAIYTRSDPRSLEFCVGSYGKPTLARRACDVSFNLSHTNNIVLLAVTKSSRVGVDAEEVCSGIEVEEISRRFFSPEEADEILTLSPEARLLAFFATWTRKEAFVKALGRGLSVPLNSFRVTVRSDDPAQLISVDWNEPSRWGLLDLGNPKMAAALAVEGTIAPVVRHFKFTPTSESEPQMSIC